KGASRPGLLRPAAGVGRGRGAGGVAAEVAGSPRHPSAGGPAEASDSQLPSEAEPVSQAAGRLVGGPPGRRTRRRGAASGGVRLFPARRGADEAGPPEAGQRLLPESAGPQPGPFLGPLLSGGLPPAAEAFRRGAGRPERLFAQAAG